MSETIRAILAELKAGLSQLYRDQLKGVYLYGSYARGEQDAESDVDVLIVLRQIGHYGAEVDRSGRLISTLSLKHGVSISRVFVSEQDWSNRVTPFLENAREEAILA